VPRSATAWCAAKIGTLLLSQILTLYTTPVVYLYQHWLAPNRRSALPRLAEKMAAATGD
jgi:hypothetical protein